MLFFFFVFCFTVISYVLSAICSEEIEAFYNWVLLFFQIIAPETI
jgi:hypothetical protein